MQPVSFVEVYRFRLDATEQKNHQSSAAERGRNYWRSTVPWFGYYSSPTSWIISLASDFSTAFHMRVQQVCLRLVCGPVAVSGAAWAWAASQAIVAPSTKNWPCRTFQLSQMFTFTQELNILKDKVMDIAPLTLKPDQPHFTIIGNGSWLARANGVAALCGRPLRALRTIVPAAAASEHTTTTPERQNWKSASKMCTVPSPKTFSGWFWSISTEITW